MTRQDKLNETHDRLVEAIESLATSDEWQAMLQVASRFHNYSFGNVCLIMSQSPEATRVAGFSTWRRLGRFVKKGERGIAILAPNVSRTRPVDEVDDEHPELVKVLRGFRVVHVFDQSQTDGAPVDDVAPVLLDGDAPGALWELLAEQVTASGFSLVRADCSPANGTTDFVARTVTVRPDLSPAQAAKTLAHEIGHTRLHEGTEYAASCRGIAEVEAESVAFLVCGTAGLATDSYSFAYVARWAAGDLRLVRTTAERVISCARTICTDAGLIAKPEPPEGAAEVDLATDTRERGAA